MNARGKDVFNVLNDYAKYVYLSWINCVGICIDGAPSVTGVAESVDSNKEM
jgi:hypothetical protein